MCRVQETRVERPGRGVLVALRVEFGLFCIVFFFFFQAEDGIRDLYVTGVQTCALPIFGFVNKMDRSGADFLGVCKQVKEKLGSKAVALQLPIGAEDQFKGVVDLINNRAIVWNEADKGMTFTEVPIPEEMKAEVAEYREKLLEAVAEYDETLIEKFFNDPNSISEKEILTALRKATIDMAIVPMVCGSSFKNKG